MTESLIAPLPTPQGATDDVAPPPSTSGSSEERAASLIYRGPEAEAAPTAEAGAEDQSDAPAEDAAPVTYEPFVLPQGVEVDTVALEQAQSLFAEARLSQPQAQKLVDLYAGKMSELVQSQISAAESRQKAWVAEVKNDPDLGGRRFESARAPANPGRARGVQQPAALPLLRPRRAGVRGGSLRRRADGSVPALRRRNALSPKSKRQIGVT
ncbi:MAG: hypothetical protein EBY18_14995 [Alphaproteobacteria bacterium]|nr:hypothetical protein [Alphaproteobacteria bacterium]